MRTPRGFALGVYLAALLLRLIPVLASRGLGIGLDDMFQYDMLARSLASGNGYRWYAREDLRPLEPYVEFDFSDPGYDPVRGVPATFRAPLYPAFLALVYSIFGAGSGRFFIARLIQAILLGAPLAPLTYFAARSLLRTQTPGSQAGGTLDGRADRAARLAAWTVACYPLLVLLPLGLGTENLFIPLVLGSFIALNETVDRPATFRFLISGVLLGLTALTRSIILPFAGLALLWLWFDSAKGGATGARPAGQPPQGTLRGLPVFAVSSLLAPTLTALALLVTLLPWIARNSILHGHLTGIETSLGYNLYVGYHPESDGSFTFGPSLDLVPILDDGERDRLGTQQAVEFMHADPGRILPLALSRLGHFFRLELRLLTYFYSNDFFGFIPAPLLLALASLVALPFAWISLSAVFGAALLPLNRSSILLWFLIAGYLAPHVLILSEERFHLALVPFLAVLAAHAWTSGWVAVKSALYATRAGRLAVSGAALAAILLLINWAWQIGSGMARFSPLLGPDGNRTFFPY